jgi:hypothetical protein
MASMYPDVASLLHAHGIGAPESREAIGGGFSGSSLTSIEHGGERYILKHMQGADDWLMRVTGDASCREAQFAAWPLLERLPARVRVPALGAARDGDGWLLLMRDISPLMLPADGIVEPPVLEVILRAAADLHAQFWGDPLADARPWLTGTRERLLMLSPATGAALAADGVEFGIVPGWQAFERRAPREAARLAARLFADLTPLLHVLDALPATLVHGDLKFGNAGVDGDTLWLIDWALVARAPAALEMAWFLGVNSSRLPWTLDETMDRYARLLEAALGAARFEAAAWPRQRAAVAVCGLLMYGWGKALDAEAGRPDELLWWCERAIAGARALGL